MRKKIGIFFFFQANKTYILQFHTGLRCSTHDSTEMVERCLFPTFSVERCPISTFWVERCPFSTLFDFTGHWSTLFDFARFCSTILDIVRLCSILFDFTGHCSTLSGISRRVLNYNDTRTSLDCFCQITFQKSQPGQPQNKIEKPQNWAS